MLTWHGELWCFQDRCHEKHWNADGIEVSSDQVLAMDIRLYSGAQIRTPTARHDILVSYSRLELEVLCYASQFEGYFLNTTFHRLIVGERQYLFLLW